MRIATHAPGEVLVHARPVQTERKSEQQLFDGYAVQQLASQRGQVPDSEDVAGCEPLQSQREPGVEREEKKPADERLASDRKAPGTPPRCGSPRRPVSPV